MPASELWNLIHYCYGTDLGVDENDKDYVSLTAEEKADFQSKIQVEEFLSQGSDSCGTSDKPLKVTFILPIDL